MQSLASMTPDEQFFPQKLTLQHFHSVPSLIVPPSSSRQRAALHVTLGPSGDAGAAPTRPLPSGCLWRKCHPGSYYSSWAGAASATTEFGPEQKKAESSTGIHPRLCQIPFSSFLSKFKDNKQGEVISPQLSISGYSQKRLDDPSEGVIRLESPLLHVWRRAGPWRCQK